MEDTFSLQFIDFGYEKTRHQYKTIIKFMGAKIKKKTDIAHIEMFFGLWHSIKKYLSRRDLKREREVPA